MSEWSQDLGLVHGWVGHPETIYHNIIDLASTAVSMTIMLKVNAELRFSRSDIPVDERNAVEL